MLTRAGMRPTASSRMSGRRPIRGLRLDVPVRPHDCRATVVGPSRTLAHADPSDRHAYPAHWEADVVLRDGGTARIRPITTDDAERLVSFYEQVSDESKYYRFFAPYPRLSDQGRAPLHPPRLRGPGRARGHGRRRVHRAPSATTGSTPTGRPPRAPADEAEVAFLVQDAHQGRGVASALLEHIAAVARERGIRRFAAEVLPANTKMIKVFTDAGYTQKRSFEDGVVRLDFDLEPTDRVPRRAARAASSAPRPAPYSGCSRPGSVAVIGAGRAPGGVGRTRPAQPPGRRLHRPAVRRQPAPSPRTARRSSTGVPAHRSVAGDRRPGRPRGRRRARRPRPRGRRRLRRARRAGPASSCPPDTRRAGPDGPGAPARTGAPGPLVRHAASSARTPSASSTPPRTSG